jgi:hypothetical protein
MVISFMKQYYVLCDVDKIACLISDNHFYKGPGQFQNNKNVYLFCWKI